MCTCIRICIYIYVHMYIYIHVYVCMYICTHVSTCSSSRPGSPSHENLTCACIFWHLLGRRRRDGGIANQIAWNASTLWKWFFAQLEGEVRRVVQRSKGSPKVTNGGSKWTPNSQEGSKWASYKLSTGCFEGL